MSSKEIGIEQARKVLGDLANEVRYTGADIILTRKGKPIARIAPLEGTVNTYTYAIECSDDETVWQAVESGTETTDDDIEEFGDAVLDNWLTDRANDGVSTSGWRVSVWRGAEQGLHPADYTAERTVEADVPM